MDAFMALDKIKADEDELKQTMIYTQRANMCDNWLVLQSKCKRDRERAARLKNHKRAALMALLWPALSWGTGALVVLPLILFLIL